MPSPSDLPVELLLDNLLPELPIRDLLSLGATNHQFAKLCDDDTFWKRKCLEDFNFSGSKTARTTGWKFIYKGLSKPKVYVWGRTDMGRLGRTSFPAYVAGGVPYPVELRLPSKTIVDLVAGGWSFHALDSRGQVYVWGTLDGEAFALQSDGYSIASKQSEHPLRLQLPSPVRTLSCGRKHSMAFDSEGQIWTFISWGRPYRLVTPALDKSSTDATPIQVECGWMYNAALTASGDTYVWWPFSVEMQQPFAVRMAQMDQEGDKRAQSTGDGTIPCVTWDLDHNPSKLPRLPELPNLDHSTHSYDDEARAGVRLVKIAAMDNFLIGLTNKGHVVKFGDLSSVSSLREGRWEYLPFFSETQKVRSHPTFARSAATVERKSGGPLPPPTSLQITHISAHFEHFVAYSTGENSIVLRGSTDTTAEEPAEIIPELQYKSIISVVLGDYHNAALTADGKVYTWGAFSAGALGLGNPKDLPVGSPGGYATQRQLGHAHARVPDVEVPTEVRFDHGDKTKRRKYCFAVTAAGWHTGALVMDPEDDEEENPEPAAAEHHDDHDPTSQMPGHFNPFPIPPFGQHGPGQIPLYPMFRGGAHTPLFRIGYAGRGAYRGGPPGGGRGINPGEGS